MSIRRSWFLRYGLLGLASSLVLASCNVGPKGEAGGKVLKVATEPAFAPFEFQGKDGQLEGFDIDLMRAIAQAEGKEVKFEALPFDGIIPALQAKTIDAAISSITITAERQKTIDFSNPYFKAGLAIAVNKDNNTVKNLDDLKGKRIAVQIGTTGAKTAKGVPDAKISTFDSAPLSLQELQNGNVDAVINDAPVTLYAISQGNINNVKVTGQLVTEEFYGIAVPKSSPNLQTINQGLRTIIDNGTYAKIYKQWFGTEPPQLPETYQPKA
jgi:arginine/lysine/histidine/glutamine transport system substrate-binding/permease protein